VLDSGSFVPPDVVALAQWTADYYAAGVGDTIPALLPPMARGGRADAHKTLRMASITPAGLEAIAASEVEGRQLEGLQILSGSPAGMATSVLAARGIAAAAISRLAKRGYISLRHDRVDRDPLAVSPPPAALGTPGSDPGPTPVRPGSDPAPAPAARALTPEQDAALERLFTLAAAGDFRVALLHGVTGSGKTEIYLRLAAAVLARGRRVLILVPEIALTPAMAAVFRDAFADRVAIQHSGLSDGERHDQWQRIRRGDIDVVVGTRSAVFAPLEQVGLIVVDEEHDGSYKQEESPRYNGRDVAIVRGRQAGALVVLGSATPSMESYHNADDRASTSGSYSRAACSIGRSPP
jgi:primosomal protein N' (replication factor Y)